MHRRLILITLLSLLTACTLPQSAPPTPPAPGNAPSQALSPAQPAASEEAVLLFAIGVHIEPLGETAQGFPGNKGDYHRPQLFQRHVEDLRLLAQIVESHGGVLVIQAQSPFTTVAIERGDGILADLAAQGHEIALHFHEDAHLGDTPERLPPEQWCTAMKEEIGYIRQASGVERVRYWSGGNLYPDLLEAAACAGLDVNSDWKNPHTQTTNQALTGVNPWRPSGGVNGDDISAFTTHDPNGAIIFLPQGLYGDAAFPSMRRTPGARGDEAYFEGVASRLHASLEAATPGMINVFHFTVHPGEFRGDSQDPFAIIDEFLTEEIDPLVAAGRVRWATFSQMADSYAAWEASQR